MLRNLFLIIVGLLICSGIAFAQTMPVPTGWDNHTYDPIVDPVIHIDPSQAKPIGVGSVATGGGMLSLHVGVSQLSGAADIYFALYAPHLDPDNLYILTSDGYLLPSETAFEPWKYSITGPINEYLFGDIPISLLPSGTYYVYLAITPANRIDTFYIWMTYFTVPELSDEYTLSVSVAGNGVVASTDGKIYCGSDCSESYPSGTVVSLSAVPDSGWNFSGWSGACSGTGVCTVSMTAAQNVTATFTQQPAQCVDVSGDWSCSENYSIKCTYDGMTETESDSGSSEITIVQDDCNISYRVPYWNDMKRTGTIQGTNIQISGSLVVPLISDVHLTQNLYTAKGQVSGNKFTLTGSGTAKGSFCLDEDCYNFTCTLTSNTVTCTRLSALSLQSAQESSGHDHSGLFIDNAFDIFGVIPLE